MDAQTAWPGFILHTILSEEGRYMENFPLVDVSLRFHLIQKDVELALID